MDYYDTGFVQSVMDSYGNSMVCLNSSGFQNPHLPPSIKVSHPRIWLNGLSTFCNRGCEEIILGISDSIICLTKIMSALKWWEIVQLNKIKNCQAHGHKS